MNLKALIQNIPKPAKQVLLIVIAAKILIFLTGYLTSYLNNGPAAPLTILNGLFNRWDAPHYVDIAKNGYVNFGEQTNFIVFFPFYPMLIKVFTFNFSYANLTALAIANFSSLIALLYLFKLAKLEFNDSVAVKSVLFLSFFPTAYFLSAPYTEGLFFALAIACLYYARTSKWEVAGTLGFFAAFTRLAGLLLLPVLILEYYHQRGWRVKKTGINVAGVFLPLAGFLMYLQIIQVVTGNPFTFINVEAAHWFNRFDPWTGLNGAYGWAINAKFPENITIGAAPIAFAVFGLVMLGIAVWKRLRLSYIVYMSLALGVAVSTSWWVSVPRYVMAMFPLFILLGVVVKKKVAVGAIVVVSAVALCFFTVLFDLGWWAF